LVLPLDPFVCAVNALVDFDRNAFEGIGVDSLEVIVVLSSVLVPLVCLDARYSGCSHESAVHNPVGLKDAATLSRIATVAAIIDAGVVQVAVSSSHVLAARSCCQVVGQATVSVILTVGAIDTVHHIQRITYIIVVGASGGSSNVVCSVMNPLTEGLLPNWLPDGTEGWRFVKVFTAITSSRQTEKSHIKY